MPTSTAPEWQDPNGDKYLPKLLSSVEPMERFCFCVISKARPSNVGLVHELLGSVAKDADVVWFVGEGAAEREAYRASGARNVVSSGSLCKARNDALRYAKQRGKFCVQLSDDIHGFTFMHQKSEWHKQSGGLNEDGHTKPSSLTESNKIAARATTRRLSALGAAQMLAAQMKKTDCKFGGLYVNSNPGTAQMCAPIMREHFCIGDFFVVDPASTCSFDEEMRLKEDYDFTCSQLRAYGKVCRFNRLLLHAEHYVNAGGAVDVRNRKEEKRNIKILRRKWPGVFLNSPRGDTEVRLYWDKRDRSLGGSRWFFPDPKKPGRALVTPEAEALALKKGLYAKLGIAVPAWLGGPAEEEEEEEEEVKKVSKTAKQTKPAKQTKQTKQNKAQLSASGHGKKSKAAAVGSPGKRKRSDRVEEDEDEDEDDTIRLGDRVYVSQKGWGRQFVYEVESAPNHKKPRAVVLLKPVDDGEHPAQAPLDKLVLLQKRGRC